MIREDIEALALADAVGALDAVEQRELQRLVAALSPGEQAEVARLYDISQLVAASVPEASPSPRVRASLMAAVTGASAHEERPESLARNYTLTAAEGEWADSPYPGIKVKVLAIDKPRNLATMLFRAQPGARYPSHRHSTCEECYVLSGSVVIEGRLLHAGDFHHAEGDSDHAELYTPEGAEVLLVGAITDYLPHLAD